MTDEKAVQLANLLAEYVRASIAEGATLEECADWTIAAVVSDIVQTTPDYLEHELSATTTSLSSLA